MTVDQKIASRIDELIVLGEKVLSTRRPLGERILGDDRVEAQLVAQWSTSCLALLSRVFQESSPHYKNFAKLVERNVTYTPSLRAQGVLKAAKDDYENSHLVPVRQLIEAEVFDDFLCQAEALLAAGYFQPAAVVAGAVLEDGLRTLCIRKGLQLSSRPKLDQMNADLAKAGVYSVLVQKRVTALAELRNKAAHGQWNEFSEEDVKEMLAAVRRFMEEHCA